MSPRGTHDRGESTRARCGRPGCGLVRTNGCSPTRSRRSNERSWEQEGEMARGLVSRVALVGVVVGALVAGAWVNVAAAGREPRVLRLRLRDRVEHRSRGVINPGTTARPRATRRRRSRSPPTTSRTKTSADAMDTLAKVWRKASKGNAMKSRGEPSARPAGSYNRTPARGLHEGARRVPSQRDLSSSDDDTTSSTDPDDE